MLTYLYLNNIPFDKNSIANYESYKLLLENIFLIKNSIERKKDYISSSEEENNSHKKLTKNLFIRYIIKLYLAKLV